MTWELNKQVLEVRYLKAPLFWDIAGKLTLEIRDRFPDFEVESAVPEVVKLNGKEKPVSLAYGLDRINLNCIFTHTAQNYLMDVCSHVFPFILKALKVSTLTRIGHRLFYELQADNTEDAKRLIHEIARACRLGADFFSSIDDARLREKTAEEILLRFSDEKTGIMCSLKPTITAFNVEGPEFLRPQLPKPKYAVTFDVDVYTIPAISTELFMPEDLIKSNIKMIETRILPNLRRSNV